ncbi:MAG: type II secretion system protein [Planctomycetota bacterium]|jgi:prepilin-type N-terminal cleavage/methylation domain-containing protein/prepilin-type processing-associated H-X9-DG protein
MRKKAFTLVELLVVMAVLSLLMALLMPALAKARQQGKSVRCLSNLRQMIIAALLYTNGNDDYFPMATVTEIDGSVYRTRCWDFTTVYDSKDRRVEPGLLWQGEMIEKIQQCPSFRGAANWAQDPYTGYNYNTSYIGGRAAVKDGRAIPQTVVMSSKVSQIKRSGACVVFGDGQWAEGANKFMRSPFAGKLDAGFFGRYAGTQGYRHLSKTNVAFCDGSARSVADCFTEAHASERANIAEGTGFLSPDNSAYDLE